MIAEQTYAGHTRADIEAAAKAATPGPWVIHERAYMGWDIDPLEPGLRGMVDRREDAEYIATANPATVLALCARVAALEAEAAPLRELGRAVEGLERHPDIGRGLYAHVVSADIPVYVKIGRGPGVNEDTLAAALIRLAKEVQSE